MSIMMMSEVQRTAESVMHQHCKSIIAISAVWRGHIYLHCVSAQCSMTEHQLCTAAQEQACQTWCLQEKTSCIIVSRAWSIGSPLRRGRYGRCAQLLW